MTHEQIKAAVLAECERLCPNPSDVHKFSVNIALQGLAKKNFKKRWQLWIWSKTLVISEDTLNEDYELGTVAFQLFGLNQPPADTKWERLKAEIVSRNEAEVEAIKSLPPIGLPQSVRDAAYATGHVLGWIQGTMTRIEQEESK